MANRWCEHDDIAVECMPCRLRVAEAAEELARIRLERALELLVHCASELEYYSGDRTHYEGCEEYHPLCRLIKNIREMTDEDEGDKAA